MSRVVSLDVEFPPSIEVPRPRIPQAAYYDAQAVCKITAFPPPAIFWKWNGTELPMDANYKISHFASQDDTITSTLTARIIVYYIGTIAARTLLLFLTLADL